MTSDSSTNAAAPDTGAKSPAEVFRAWADAFNRGDEAGMRDCFEDNAVILFPPGNRAIVGADAISKAAVQLANGATFTIHNIDTIEHGDLALVYVTRTRSTTDADGRTVHVTGTTSDVARRQPDRRWLIAIDNPNGLTAPRVETPNT